MRIKESKKFYKKKNRMKKVIFIIMLAVASATATAQSGMELKDYNVFYKLNDENIFRSMIRYLELSTEQAENLQYVNDLTERKLNYANKKASTVAAEKAMLFNLGNAKAVLTEAQYRKYLIVLNVSRFSEYEEYIAEK